MARDQRQTTLVTMLERRRDSEPSGRLPAMPLTALLPRLGELSALALYADELSARLAELQERNFAQAEDDADLRKQRALEESMLNQALQWLSIQTSQE